MIKFEVHRNRKYFDSCVATYQLCKKNSAPWICVGVHACNTEVSSFAKYLTLSLYWGHIKKAPDILDLSQMVIGDRCLVLTANEKSCNTHWKGSGGIQLFLIKEQVDPTCCISTIN